MSFKLGKRSLERLEGVDERMVEIVKLAITLSKNDFTVLEGLRTKERQAELVKAGNSQTMKSKHLEGKAVDLGAYDPVTGIRWEENAYFPIADAMAEAAKKLDIKLCWGAAWAVPEHAYPYNCADWDGDMKSCWKAYHDLRRSQGRRGFNDMPHFELIG